MSEVIHTHEDGPEGAFFGTHTHDGFEHTHDEPESRVHEQEVEQGGVIHGWHVDDDLPNSSDNVDAPGPKRQVPVIISGVNHGMRDADEGE